jgi:hypothetical protein
MGGATARLRGSYEEPLANIEMIPGIITTNPSIIQYAV